MIRNTCALIFGSVLMSATAVTSAHPGHGGDDSASASALSSAVRTWVILSDLRAYRGSFVTADRTSVQLRLVDDSLRKFPIASLTPDDQAWVAARKEIIRSTVAPRDETKAGASKPGVLAAMLTVLATHGVVISAPPPTARPEIANSFDPFVKTKAITTHWDADWFFVESKGIPDHPMMVGIKSWQQQVPIPQDYTGDNAWRIPLHPVPAKTPTSTNGKFLRGAIALAVNGVPIFNPLNNRGDDALKFGELDEYGGHCGRADDYHYHVAPLQLQKVVGKSAPIAYALDGYPIYGYDEPDGSTVKGLDAFNGHADAGGQYHYHATKDYPYLNGGFHGEVVERDGQVDPQPRAHPIRPALPPLRGATVTGFTETKLGSYRLTYEIAGKEGTVAYARSADGSATFEFVDTAGHRSSETYRGEQRRSEPREGEPRKSPSKARTDSSAARRPTERNSETLSPASRAVRLSKAELRLTSDSVDASGRLSVDCTCDGKRASPSIRWAGAPAGTKSFAITLWHTAPDMEKSYWLAYRIPADVTSIAQGGKVPGLIGLNDRRRAEYDPMCSKGPGVKTYHLTVYALSGEPALVPEKATRSDLLKAVKDIVVAEGTMDFTYERAESK